MAIRLNFFSEYSIVTIDKVTNIFIKIFGRLHRGCKKLQIKGGVKINYYNYRLFQIRQTLESLGEKEPELREKLEKERLKILKDIDRERFVEK